MGEPVVFFYGRVGTMHFFLYLCSVQKAQPETMYKPTDKMALLMSAEPQALRVISRFRLPLGVGDKTIKQVCDEHSVHTDTFLAIINYRLDNNVVVDITTLSLPTLIGYLRQSHEHFFTFTLPMLRRKLIEAVNGSVSDMQVPMLIIRFFDEYVNEMNTHMEHENNQVFPYVEGLLRGERNEAFNSEQFAKQHRTVDDQNIADKLTELKNLIIKYYPPTADNSLLLSALYDLFLTEHDLAVHCAIEDHLLLPAVRRLEDKSHIEPVAKSPKEEDTEELSEREKEVLIEVVNGLSNKEIADKLFISIHTVISHRKNISRKLNIHSPAGLTIYAIVNKLVDIEKLK